MRVRIPGWIAWTTAALAALVALLVALSFTPQASRWGHDWLVRQVAELWELDLVASRLRVNILTRRAVLEDVKLSAPGHGAEPFFTARRLEVTLPWAVFRGTVRLTSLEVDDGRVLMVREGGVLVNLPPPSGELPPEVPRRLDIRGLQLRGLDLDYVDRTGDIDVAVADMTTDLDDGALEVFTGASGPVRATSIRVRMGKQSTESGAVEGRMAFDGSTVSLQGLTAPFPEARVVAEGRIDRALDAMTFALKLTGTLDLTPILAWTPPLVPVSGTGTFQGTFEGPLGGYTLRADFTAPATRIGQAEPMPLTGTMFLTPTRLTIDPFALTAAAATPSPRTGTVNGTFGYQLGGKGATDVAVSFRDLDLDVALAAYEREPLTFAAFVDGSATIRFDAPAAPMQLQASGTSQPLTRPERVAVGGTWSAALKDERWTFRHDHQMLDGVRAFGTMTWPAADTPEASPLSGPLTLEIADVGPVVLAARRSGIDLSEFLGDVHGPAHGDLVMDGTLAAMVIRGRVEATELRVPPATTEAAPPGGMILAASADIVYDLETLTATAFELSTAGGRVFGRVSMGMESGSLEGEYKGGSDDLSTLLASTGLTGVGGQAEVSGTIGGTTEVPDVPFEVASTALTYEATALGNAIAHGRLLGTDIQFEDLRLEQGGGGVTGSGRYDYVTGAYTIDADIRGFTVQQPIQGAAIEAVRLDGEFAGSGTLAEPGGSGRLTVTPLGGSYADVVGPTRIQATFAGGLLNATAFLPSLRTFAQATVDPTAPYAVKGTAVVNAADIQPIATSLGLRPEAVSGTVGLSATFEGAIAKPEDAQAFVNLQEVALSVGGLPVRLDGPARLTVRMDDFSVDDLALTAGQSRLRVSGRFLDSANAPLRASLEGDVADMLTMARAFDLVPAAQATGRLAATWESRGSISQATSTMTIANGTVSMEGYPPVEGLEASAAFDGSIITVESIKARWQGGDIDGTARVPRALVDSSAPRDPAARGRVDVRVRGLTQQALTPWLPASTVSQLDARVSATLALDITSPDLNGLAGTLVLDEAAVTAAGVPIKQEREGRMSIANGRLTFDDVAFSAGTPVVIGGSVAFADPITLDVTLKGTPGLRPLSVLSPTMAVDGAAELDLRITGTAAAPRLEGRIALDDAEIVMREPQVIASDITGTIRFLGNAVALDGIHGFLNGGDLDASGEVQVDGTTVTGGDLTFQAQGVALEYPENVDSEIDAILTFVPGPGPPRLTGDVRVQRASYQAAISLPGLLALSQTRPVAQGAAAPTYADTIRLDLAVSTVEDIAIDNNYGRFEAGADLRVQGTVARPGATGRIDLREGGELYVLGGQYRLNDSSISLTNPATIEPDLNISAVTSASGNEDTLTLSGTLDRLSTTVTSSNPDANQGVLDVLLRTNSLNREDALALLSGELLGVGRALGLDSLRVDRGVDLEQIRQDAGQLASENIDPSTRLTLSKRVRSDIEVILSQDLGRSGGLSAVVSYRPWRGLELRGTQRDNSDRNYAIRHQITFGGRSPAATSRRVLPRVAEVLFDGAPPADEPQLRRQLKLTSGDRFDFVDWREDLDRMREWYAERGQLEARIRASRAERPGGTTALTYRVTAGPQTELRVEGTPVSAGLRRSLEAAWSSAVFDRFLLDELRWLVQVDLVKRNVIGATVDAELSEVTDTRKVARISVTGGRQARGRRLRFEGTRALSPSDLESQVIAAGLDHYVWMEPLAIVQPLSNRYYAAGYRQATVESSPVIFEDDVAVLPVTVDEGPATTLAVVSYTGVDETLREDVGSATQLSEGEVYPDGVAEEAGRRIAAVYRSRGYNNVEVTPKVAVDDAAHTASVTFDVVPGAKQVLTEVVVDGAERTKESAVRSALGLKPDTPVDYGAWAQARKRVYDTNVFRQVEVRPEVVAPGASGTEGVRARVTVSEWPTWRLRYGLQLDDALNPATEAAAAGRSQELGVTADLQNRNVLGRAFTFGITGRAERQRTFSSTYFTFPTLFGRPVVTNVFVSAAQEDLELDGAASDLRDTTTQLSLEQRVRRGRSFQVVYGYRIKRVILAPIDPDPEDFFRQDTRVGRFTASVFSDRRDNPFDARRGWFAALNVERVTEFESGDDTIKTLATAYWYRTLGRITLASAGRLGGSFLDPLLFSERFYVGGADSVRGYGEDGAGPKDFLGIARGGNALLILNQEARAHITTWMQGVAFVDAGNVFSTNSAISFGDLQVGYGAGLRFDTPFSIFRVDVGWPASGSGRPRWYFGLGQVF